MPLYNFRCFTFIYIPNMNTPFTVTKDNGFTIVTP